MAVRFNARIVHGVVCTLCIMSKRYGSSSSILYRLLIDPLLAPLRPKVARLCLRHGLDIVLDIGSATGAQCRALDAVGIRAIGLDLSEEMIVAARKGSPETITYQVGSGYNLPFPQASFTGALLSLALHEHSEGQRANMIREAIRILKPGGSLVLAEYSRPRQASLHIPWLIIRLIENLAGAEHRAGFRQFIATDGIHGLLRRHNLHATDIVTSHFQTLTIVVVPIREVP